MPGIEGRYSLIECGVVKQAGYKFKLCAHGHHWYRYLEMCTEGTSDCMSYPRLVVMAVVTLESGHSGTAYT